MLCKPGSLFSKHLLPGVRGRVFFESARVLDRFWLVCSWVLGFASMLNRFLMEYWNFWVDSELTLAYTWVERGWRLD